MATDVEPHQVDVLVDGGARCVAVANGTYSGYAVKVNGRWMLNRPDLTPIIFNPIFQSGAGCKQRANACGRAVMARPMP
jgi:hypothetical protein